MADAKRSRLPKTASLLLLASSLETPEAHNPAWDQPRQHQSPSRTIYLPPSLIPLLVSTRSTSAPNTNVSSPMVEDEGWRPHTQARSLAGSFATITWSTPLVPCAFNFSAFYIHANTSARLPVGTPCEVPPTLKLAAEPGLENEASAISNAQPESIRSLREHCLQKQAFQCNSNWTSIRGANPSSPCRSSTTWPRRSESHWSEYREKQPWAIGDDTEADRGAGEGAYMPKGRGGLEPE